MLGVLLSMVNQPIDIQNSGFFFAGVSAYVIVLSTLVAIGLIYLRDAVDELIQIEAENAWLDGAIQVETRFSDIVERATSQGLALA